MDRTVAEKLCELRERVAQRIGHSRFRTWFESSAELRLSPDRLEVVAANSFAKSWIVGNYMADLAQALQDVLGVGLPVEVWTPVDGPDSSNGKPGPSTPLKAPPSRPVDPPTAPAALCPLATVGRRVGTLRGRLEDFVAGPSNQLAYAAASCVARAPGRDYRVLVLYGPCGVGKTHLLHGICNAVNESHKELRWCYISGEEFTNDYISALRSGIIDRFRERFRTFDVLAIDDVHFLADKRGTEREFLHTFNAIDVTGKVVVLTSDRHPKAIDSLSEPLSNRLLAGMVVDIAPPDIQTRRQILARRSAALPNPVPNEVLEFLAQRISHSVRELEGALVQYVALAALPGARAGVALAEAAIRGCGQAAAPAKPTLSAIVDCTASYFGVSREHIFSPSRDRTVALARAAAMHLVRQHTGMSFPEIGRQMGRKPHSTVIMAVQRVHKALASEEGVQWKSITGVRHAKLKDVLEQIEKRLRGE